eukprot:TRINITY_DN1453_c0_g1_i1.p1 TRINITY_DN1453_c0_g1~~TRINITY_DN1453_c0_g1_i1.p1  ORF type:complete len:1954 (-),score=470.57 TRINITY_DN1453_c0_g1_i1:60-5843(-)
MEESSLEYSSSLWRAVYTRRNLLPAFPSDSKLSSAELLGETTDKPSKYALLPGSAGASIESFPSLWEEYEDSAKPLQEGFLDISGSSTVSPPQLLPIPSAPPVAFGTLFVNLGLSYESWSTLRHHLRVTMIRVYIRDVNRRRITTETVFPLDPLVSLDDDIEPQTVVWKARFLVSGIPVSFAAPITLRFSFVNHRHTIIARSHHLMDPKNVWRRTQSLDLDVFGIRDSATSAVRLHTKCSILSAPPELYLTTVDPSFYQKEDLHFALSSCLEWPMSYLSVLQDEHGEVIVQRGVGSSLARQSGVYVDSDAEFRLCLTISSASVVSVLGSLRARGALQGDDASVGCMARVETNEGSPLRRGSDPLSWIHVPLELASEVFIEIPLDAKWVEDGKWKEGVRVIVCLYNKNEVAGLENLDETSPTAAGESRIRIANASPPPMSSSIHDEDESPGIHPHSSRRILSSRSVLSSRRRSDSSSSADRRRGSIVIPTKHEIEIERRQSNISGPHSPTSPASPFVHTPHAQGRTGVSPFLIAATSRRGRASPLPSKSQTQGGGDVGASGESSLSPEELFSAMVLHDGEDEDEDEMLDDDVDASQLIIVPKNAILAFCHVTKKPSPRTGSKDGEESMEELSWFDDLSQARFEVFRAVNGFGEGDSVGSFEISRRLLSQNFRIVPMSLHGSNVGNDLMEFLEIEDPLKCLAFFIRRNGDVFSGTAKQVSIFFSHQIAQRFSLMWKKTATYRGTDKDPNRKIEKAFVRGLLEFLLLAEAEAISYDPQFWDHLVSSLDNVSFDLLQFFVEFVLGSPNPLLFIRPLSFLAYWFNKDGHVQSALEGGLVLLRLVEKAVIDGDLAPKGTTMAMSDAVVLLRRLNKVSDRKDCGESYTKIVDHLLSCPAAAGKIEGFDGSGNHIWDVDALDDLQAVLGLIHYMFHPKEEEISGRKFALCIHSMIRSVNVILSTLPVLFSPSPATSVELLKNDNLDHVLRTLRHGWMESSTNILIHFMLSKEHRRYLSLEKKRRNLFFRNVIRRILHALMQHLEIELATTGLPSHGFHVELVLSLCLSLISIVEEFMREVVEGFTVREIVHLSELIVCSLPKIRPRIVSVRCAVSLRVFWTHVVGMRSESAPAILPLLLRIVDTPRGINYRLTNIMDQTQTRTEFAKNVRITDTYGLESAKLWAFIASLSFHLSIEDHIRNDLVERILWAMGTLSEGSAELPMTALSLLGVTLNSEDEPVNVIVRSALRIHSRVMQSDFVGPHSKMNGSHLLVVSRRIRRLFSNPYSLMKALRLDVHEPNLKFATIARVLEMISVLFPLLYGPLGSEYAISMDESSRRIDGKAQPSTQDIGSRDVFTSETSSKGKAFDSLRIQIPAIPRGQDGDGTSGKKGDGTPDEVGGKTTVGDDTSAPNPKRGRKLSLLGRSHISLGGDETMWALVPHVIQVADSAGCVDAVSRAAGILLSMDGHAGEHVGSPSILSSASVGIRSVASILEVDGSSDASSLTRGKRGECIEEKIVSSIVQTIAQILGRVPEGQRRNIRVLPASVNGAMALFEHLLSLVKLFPSVVSRVHDQLLRIDHLLEKSPLFLLRREEFDLFVARVLINSGDGIRAAEWFESAAKHVRKHGTVLAQKNAKDKLDGCARNKYNLWGAYFAVLFMGSKFPDLIRGRWFVFWWPLSNAENVLNEFAEWLLHKYPRASFLYPVDTDPSITPSYALRISPALPVFDAPMPHQHLWTLKPLVSDRQKIQRIVLELPHSFPWMTEGIETHRIQSMILPLMDAVPDWVGSIIKLVHNLPGAKVAGPSRDRSHLDAKSSATTVPSRESASASKMSSMVDPRFASLLDLFNDPRVDEQFGITMCSRLLREEEELRMQRNRDRKNEVLRAFNREKKACRQRGEEPPAPPQIPVEPIPRGVERVIRVRDQYLLTRSTLAPL